MRNMCIIYTLLCILESFLKYHVTLKTGAIKYIKIENITVFFPFLSLFNSQFLYFYLSYSVLCIIKNNNFLSFNKKMFT